MLTHTEAVIFVFSITFMIAFPVFLWLGGQVYINEQIARPADQDKSGPFRAVDFLKYASNGVLNVTARDNTTEGSGMRILTFTLGGWNCKAYFHPCMTWLTGGWKFDWNCTSFQIYDVGWFGIPTNTRDMQWWSNKLNDTSLRFSFSKTESNWVEGSYTLEIFDICLIDKLWDPQQDLAPFTLKDKTGTIQFEAYFWYNRTQFATAELAYKNYDLHVLYCVSRDFEKTQFDIWSIVLGLFTGNIPLLPNPFNWIFSVPFYSLLILLAAILVLKAIPFVGD